MNRTKVLSVERKVKVIRQVENGKKKPDESREFGLVNSASRTVWEIRTKILVRSNRTDRELSYLVSQN
jgi:hypothetical protein